MSISVPAVDYHQPACDALERSTPVLVEAIRRAPGDVRPAKMRWTNAEIAAHMFASVVEADKVVRGVPSAYDGTGPSAALDEQMVSQVRERDPEVLAAMTEHATVEFLSSARARAGDDQVAMPRSTVTTLVGLLALDHHLHGGQFAQTAGSRWTGRVADLHAPFSAVLTYAFDPEAAKTFRGSYTMRLESVEPIRFGIADGVLRLNVSGRTDCTMTSDVQTFLRLGIGVVSQVRATFTGRIRAGGRKPWLAMATNRLFPPVPHGGVAHRGA
jgi:hypothetical protein